MNESLAIN